MSLQQKVTVSDTANSNLQNQINISIIFNYIRNHGVAYRAQIVRDLKISAPAVSRAVEKLLRDGYLIQTGKTHTEDGRKALQFAISANRGYIVGVDILTDPIEIAISDFAGTVLYSHKGPFLDRDADFDAFLGDAIEEALESFRSEQGQNPGNILAVGIGVPAVVDPENGKILSASLYKNLICSDLKTKIGERFGAPVFVENISNLAAIGEWKHGAGQGVRNMVFIELSNGVGAGIILDGDLYRGVMGSAGEVGFFITRPDGLGYDSSKQGYLESISSLNALRERGARCVFEDDGSREKDPISRLCKAASAGSEEAKAIIQESIAHLTVAIVNIMVVLNPEIVVIGGNICEIPGAESQITWPLIEAVQRNYPFLPATVLPTSLGSRASVIGALQFALDSIIVHAYPYHLKMNKESARD